MTDCPECKCQAVELTTSQLKTISAALECAADKTGGWFAKLARSVRRDIEMQTNITADFYLLRTYDND